MEKIEINLANGESVKIEVENYSSAGSDDAESPPSGVVETSGGSALKQGVERVSVAVDTLPNTTLTDFGASVASFAKSVLEGMRDTLPQDEAEVKVEFGANISLKGGFSLVSVGANASVKVTISSK